MILIANDNMEKYIGKYLDNRYELLEIIGSGGMAVVFKAMCHRLNRLVAVKIMRPEFVDNEEFRKRFQSESLAIAQLSHANIVGVYDVSHSDSIEYIVMELLDGQNLKQYLHEKNGPLDVNQTLAFSTEIALALKHAHSKGIIHRDIKPQNIVVVDESTVKVADFGIAALQSEVQIENGQAIGSVHYLSPEQAKGKAADERSDIYSLGICMYEMLTGKMPYDGDDDRSVALQHLSGNVQPIREQNLNVKPELEKIVLKAMSVSPANRYQSANEMLADLNEVSRLYNNKTEAADGNVIPVRVDTKETREAYLARRRRAKKVSTYSGLFGVLAFILFLSIFLWNYLLRDIFIVRERIQIPNFVGSNYETLVNNKNYNGTYTFEVSYEINPNVDKGIVLSQSPEAGKSYMLSDDGINIKLSVSTGILLTDVPDCINKDYREIVAQLEGLGFVVEKEYEFSSSVEKDRVISTNPTSGQQIPAGSTIYLTISNGPETEVVTMPYLIGSDIYSAQSQIASAGLVLVTVSEVNSDTFEEGLVISQNVEAGTSVAVGSKIYLQVSLGPEETPTPEPTEEVLENVDDFVFEIPEVTPEPTT